MAVTKGNKKFTGPGNNKKKRTEKKKWIYDGTKKIFTCGLIVGDYCMIWHVDRLNGDTQMDLGVKHSYFEKIKVKRMIMRLRMNTLQTHLTVDSYRRIIKDLFGNLFKFNRIGLRINFKLGSSSLMNQFIFYLVVFVCKTLNFVLIEMLIYPITHCVNFEFPA